MRFYLAPLFARFLTKSSEVILTITTSIVLFGGNIMLFGQNHGDTLSEVVLESRRNKRLTPAVLYSNLDTVRIAQYSPTGLTQVLNEIPGVHVFSGGMGTNRLTVRGVGARTPYGTSKIQAYYNGIPITSGIGETTFNIYDPETIQNIDLISGPKASLYGANLGGAMLLYTKRAAPHTTVLKESFNVGSFGLLKNSLSFNHQGEDFNVNLFHDHLETDGFRENSAYDRGMIMLDAGLALNSKNELQLLFQQLNYTAHIASSISKSDLENDPSVAASNWGDARGYEDNKITTVGLSYINSISNELKNKTAMFYSYLDHYEPRPFNILDEFSNSYGFRTSFLGSLELLRIKNTFEVGMEWYHDTYHWLTLENLYEQNNGAGSLAGELLSDNKEYRNRWNAFMSWDIFVDQWTFTAGLHLNSSSYSFRDYFNSGQANKNAKRDFDAVWAPSLSVGYKVSSNWKLNGNLSYGYNIPNLEETLTPDGVINPQIGPETGWNYEIATFHSLLNHKLDLSLVLYYMDVENLLVSDRVGEDQYIGRNAGKVSHKGIEFQANYNGKIFKRLLFKPYLNLTINHHEFEEFISEDIDYSGNKLTGVPENILAAGLLINDPIGLFFSTALKHVGQTPLNDANTLYNKSYTVINLKAGYQRVLVEGLQMKVTFGVDNLLDEKYASSILVNAVGFGNAQPRYYYPGLPVNYYGGLALTYQFK